MAVIFFSVQAAEKGNEACLKLLLDKGASVDEKDKWGCTALIWVCFFKISCKIPCAGWKYLVPENKTN